MPEAKVKKVVAKKVASKAAVKTPVKAVKTEVKVEAPKEAAPRKTGDLSITAYSLLGVKSGEVTLPKEIFGAEINKALLAQAVRVYMNNEKGHFSNTKTRGEVEGSTRKIFKQKGTGRARHGAIRANIFVGGGIALGPKSRKIMLDLPKKMKKAALISALSQKLKDNRVDVVTGVDKATGKTKEMAKLVEKLGKKSVLFVTGDKNEMAIRGMRNIESVEFMSADQINVFEVVKHGSLLLTKDALISLEKRIIGGAN